MELTRFMACLHYSANVQQTTSECIQNTRANAGRLLKVCRKFAGRLLDRVNTLLLFDELTSGQTGRAYCSLVDAYVSVVT